MARGKQKSISQGNQNSLATTEPSSLITASIGITNTPEKEDTDLKSYLKMLIEILKQNGRKSKKIQKLLKRKQEKHSKNSKN